MTKAKTKTAAAKKPAAKAKTKSAPKKTSKPVAAAKAKPAPRPRPSRRPGPPHTSLPRRGPPPRRLPQCQSPHRTRRRPHPAKAAAPASAAKPVAAACSKGPAPQPFQAAPKPSTAGLVVSTPAAKKLVFKVNELVVYPAHGVGKISQIEEQEIAGARLELYIVEFEKEKLRLKVPTSRAEQKGMRRLSDKTQIESALKVLKGRARIKRTMWSRRAQEYDAKINSGDIMAVAEVVRDLYRSERQPEQSYSERQLFEQALDRMAREIAAVKRIDDDQAMKELEEYLSKNAKRAPAGDKTEEDVPAEEAA
jgi:CarD family transcriptional regulator